MSGKRFSGFLASAAVALVMAGCAAPPGYYEQRFGPIDDLKPPPGYAAPGNIDEVTPGMKNTDVIRIMGNKPYHARVVSGEIVWVYPQGKVFIRESPGMFAINYTVIRVDGSARIVKLEINSEPQGARIYEKGRLKGSAPLTLSYRIDDAAFQSGAIELAPMVAVHDTCRPGQVQLRLEVDPAWREGKPPGPHCFGHLFLLERDPNYKPPTIIVQQPPPPSGDNVNVNVQTQRDKDALDYLEQAGRVGIIMKTLKAMGR